MELGPGLRRGDVNFAPARRTNCSPLRTTLGPRLRGDDGGWESARRLRRSRFRLALVIARTCANALPLVQLGQRGSPRLAQQGDGLRIERQMQRRLRRIDGLDDRKRGF